jgi:hypothetical protein
MDNSATQNANQKEFNRKIKQLLKRMEYPEIKPMPIVFFVKANNIKKMFELYKKNLLAELVELESLNEDKKHRKTSGRTGRTTPGKAGR